VISFNESARVNKLYYGDNLTVLRGSIDDESVDLIYRLCARIRQTPWFC